MKSRQKETLLKTLEREKKRNYFILYTVTLMIWLVLVIFAFNRGFWDSDEFVVNIINNIIGIIPPILIFDFFAEKLTRDSSTIEMSNKITETLMSTPETMDLFTEAQRKEFIRSAIASIVKDDDATEMVNDSLRTYLFSDTNYRLRTYFDYDFELSEKVPSVYDEILTDKSKYFYVQEKLHYTVRYLSDEANNTNSDMIKIGFVFDNKSLDNVLREKKNNELFKNCIFRESLDIAPEDVELLKRALLDKNKIHQMFKIDLQIDSFKGELDNIIISDKGFVCVFKVGHNIDADEHNIRIIFHMPKRWDSILEVALLDPVKAPKISVSYPEDAMHVDMFPFLSKGEESSLEVAHEHLNGIYDIVINSEWIYPVSGIIFNVNKK